MSNKTIQGLLPMDRKTTNFLFVLQIDKEEDDDNNLDDLSKSKFWIVDDLSKSKFWIVQSNCLTLSVGYPHIFTLSVFLFLKMKKK
jgi:hypothetical protein